MSPFITCFLFAASVLAARVPQGRATRLADAIYDQFAAMIRLEQQFAEAKLNSIVSLVQNATGSSLTDAKINETLTQCFVDAVAEYPSADQTCVQDVNATVDETIYDSQQQLAYCANLTHGWIVANDLLLKAGPVNASLNAVVEQVLNDSLVCCRRYPKNPTKEYSCMLNVRQKYDDAWQNSTVYIDQAYGKLSGISLMVFLNANDCLTLEENTLQDKCASITVDVEGCTQSEYNKKR